VAGRAVKVAGASCCCCCCVAGSGKFPSCF
jgi:hypothetical protein